MKESPVLQLEKAQDQAARRQMIDYTHFSCQELKSPELKAICTTSSVLNENKSVFDRGMPVNVHRTKCYLGTAESICNSFSARRVKVTLHGNVNNVIKRHLFLK